MKRYSKPRQKDYCLTFSPLLGGAIRLRRSVYRMPIRGRGTVHERHILTILGRLILDFALFSFTPIVLGNTRENETIGDTKDEEQPEQIERLEGGQQRGGDELREPALVLASCPIQHVGSDGAKLGEDGKDDLEVQVVAKVDPDTHKHGEVRTLQGTVDVVQGL